MSSPSNFKAPLDILGIGVVVPDDRISVTSIFEQESEHIEHQLSALTPAFRARLVENLGVAQIACFVNVTSSQAGRQAAEHALAQAQLAPDRIAFVLDYTTFAVDRPGIWSLAHDVAHHVEAKSALCFGAHGSGCAGLHAALLLASSLLAAQPSGTAALLVAADRAPDLGRSCLPISMMADAATAIVVVRGDTSPCRLARVSAVALQHVGRFAGVLTVDGSPARMQVDSATFERKVLPLHFIMLHRALSRALTHAEGTLGEMTAIVYPNTSELDRMGILRGLGLNQAMLIGPGPSHLGHAFANDMLINAAALFAPGFGANRPRTAWLAAGSGFSWGAAIVDFGIKDVTG